MKSIRSPLSCFELPEEKKMSDVKNHSKTLDTIALLRRLEKPKGRVDVILDTDTYNEIDDQFALSYMLRSPEKLNVKAIYAAPFHNEKSDGPADGMEKSYQEILNILELAGRAELKQEVYRGSLRYLPDEETPVDSPAAANLAERAMEYTPDRPLYVAAIGAITNIASAILMNPEIIDRIVVVWLGGNAHNWPDSHEFNLFQDIAAARIVFGCGVALVQPPPAAEWYLPLQQRVRSWNTIFPGKMHFVII